MERSEKSTSLDAVITLVDTISSKLQLVSQDYRGIDALNLELSFFHQLLLRTRYFNVRRNQPSLLFDLFEELRHFCLILRAERRLEYVMVEEISRFREILAIFQRRFCESNDTRLLDFVLAKLKKMDDSHELGKLKVELKLTKLVYLCHANQASDECQSISTIMSEIYEDASQFYFVSEDSSPNHELVSSFRASLSKCCKLQFSEMQSDSNLAWSVSQLNEFHDSLSAALWDVYIWGQSHSTVNNFIQPVINTAAFLKIFMRFTRQMKRGPAEEVFIQIMKRVPAEEVLTTRPMRSAREVFIDVLEPPCVSETFLIHFKVLAIDAACLGYMCWFYRDDEDDEQVLQSKSRELLDKVRSGSGEIQMVILAFIEYLINSNGHMLINLYGLSEYNIYLRDHLFQLVPVLPLDQMERLATILNHIHGVDYRHDKAGANAALHKLKEVIVVVFQLYMLGKKDKMPAELELRVLQLLGTDTSPSTCVNGLLIPQCPFHRILRKRSFLTTNIPRLIVNGVVVSSEVWGIEQIKYQLLKDSTGRDLIGVVTKDIASVENMVNRDTEISDHFKIRAQCCFPSWPLYDLKGMLRSILNTIPSTRSSNYADMSEEHLGRVLYECLQGKRYLLVLELYKWHLLDLGFHKRSRAWRGLISSLPKDGNGSKILLMSCAISDIACFSLEPYSSIHQVIGKMGTCFKRK